MRVKYIMNTLNLKPCCAKIIATHAVCFTCAHHFTNAEKRVMLAENRQNNEIQNYLNAYSAAYSNGAYFTFDKVAGELMERKDYEDAHPALKLYPKWNERLFDMAMTKDKVGWEFYETSYIKKYLDTLTNISESFRVFGDTTATAEAVLAAWIGHPAAFSPKAFEGLQADVAKLHQARTDSALSGALDVELSYFPTTAVNDWKRGLKRVLLELHGRPRDCKEVIAFARVIVGYLRTPAANGAAPCPPLRPWTFMYAQDKDRPELVEYVRVAAPVYYDEVNLKIKHTAVTKEAMMLVSVLPFADASFGPYRDIHLDCLLHCLDACDK